MKLLWANQIISHSNPITCVVYYILIASNLCIHGNAINLPKNVKFPAFLAFGDSVIDPGNNNYIPTIGRGNFPPYGRDLNGGVPTGRFSNGKVPSDFFAEELGIKELVPPYLDPTLQISDLLTGVSFASGACGYDPLSPLQANALSFDDQLDLFKQYINRLEAAVGGNTTSTILSESMYLVCAGSNDITQTYSLRELHYTISSYTDFLLNKATSFVQELYKLGARRIGVVSIPPCGCLPAQRTVGGGLSRKCVDKQNKGAALFNSKLIHQLSSLNQKLLGSRFVYLDIYNPLLNMINNPSQYGFEVSNLGCCGTGKIEVTLTCNKFCWTCDDASKYVFWDAFHPTEKTYRIIVQGLLVNNINEFF